jgi:hypothetical protein
MRPAETFGSRNELGLFLALLSPPVSPAKLYRVCVTVKHPALSASIPIEYIGKFSSYVSFGIGVSLWHIMK